LYIQEKIKSREIELVWSYVLDVENEHNPFEERKKAIEKWKSIAVIDVEETRDLIVTANSLLKKGVRPKDALHVASAIEGKASYFLTTDDKLIKKLSNICEIQIINPVDMVGIIDEHDD